MEGGRYTIHRPDTPAPIFVNAFEELIGDSLDSYNSLITNQLDSSEYLDGLGLQGQHADDWEFSLDIEQQEQQAALRRNTSNGGPPDPVKLPNFLDREDEHAIEGLQFDCESVALDWDFHTESAPPTDQDFLQWIAGAHRPPVSCSYCQYHRLECLIIRTTTANPNPVTSCSSCVALFRECSLAIGEKRKASEFETNEPILGHLHGVNEEYQAGLEFFDWQGATESPNPGVGLTFSLPEGHSVMAVGDKGKRTMSKQDIRVLKAWLSENRGYPYPTEDEKLVLRATTGLTILQISNWFANARRRRRQTHIIPIPSRSQNRTHKEKSQEALSPIERWKSSPPEEDPVDPSIIEKAITSLTRTDKSYELWPGGSEIDVTLSNKQHTPFDTRSMSSREASLSGLSSDSSTSAWSLSSYASHRSYTSITCPKRRSHQKRKQSDRTSTAGVATPYHCTFCSESFKKKYDWQRHEKSVHLPLEHWVCSTGDGTVVLPDSTSPQCIFCGIHNPLQAHLIAHEFNTCSERPTFERIFRSKDHLRQHLVKFHACLTPMDCVMKLWKVEWTDIRSRCGFCDAWFTNWEERSTHLAAHFKSGIHMEEWAGDWGLGDEVLAILQNAVLPGVNLVVFEQ